MVSHMAVHQNRSFARQGDASDTAYLQVRESTKIDADRVEKGYFYERNNAAIRVFGDPSARAFVFSRTLAPKVSLQVSA